jgi:HNH/Endo VII superfamily toxin with a SHH signature
LREYLHDMSARGELTQASEALSHCQDLPDAQRLFDAAITRWATEKGGSAKKVGGRWEFTRADGTVIREWEVDTFKNLADNRATGSYFQAHHGIQDLWAKDRKIPGYTRDACPAIELRDSYAGSPHQRITARQASRRGKANERTYAEERKLMIEDLQGAEVSKAQADRLVNESDKYFGDLYKKWAADLKAKGLPDTDLKAAFGDWEP